MVLPHMALAAAPRDAVKNMPTLTHTSTFTIDSSDDDGTHNYTDTYRDYWRINWSTGKQRLAGGAWTKLDLSYETTWTDILKRMSGVSQDSRFDKLVASLDFNDTRDFSASFKLEQQDTYSGSTPSTTDRAWSSKTNKYINATWSRDRFPKLSLGHTINNSYQYSGTEQVHGSESATTQLIGEYKWQTNSDWQSAAVKHEYVRSDNYGAVYDDKHTGTSKETTEYNVQRLMSFPHLGRLSLGLYHYENSSAPLGSSSYSTSYSTKCNAALEGSVREMPLGYRYNYWTQQSGTIGSGGNLRARREFTLNLNPPVPAGKSGSVSYVHSVDETNYTNNENTTEEQKLTWNFMSNPRTSTTFTYGLKQVTDRINQKRTEDNEGLTATVNYTIPGGRGSLSGKVGETINRQPDTDKRITADYYQLNSNFALGPGTSINLLFNQRNNETRTSLLSEPSGNDEFYSKVIYRTQGKGLGLEATYEQRHRKTINTERKTDVESMKVVLSYQTDAKWKYSLTLATNSEAQDSTAATGYDYQTNESITAMVSCTF